eukprot:2807437-Amphidinium_carterae.1
MNLVSPQRLQVSSNCLTKLTTVWPEWNKVSKSTWKSLVVAIPEFQHNKMQTVANVHCNNRGNAQIINLVWVGNVQRVPTG